MSSHDLATGALLHTPWPVPWDGPLTALAELFRAAIALLRKLLLPFNWVVQGTSIYVSGCHLRPSSKAQRVLVLLGVPSSSQPCWEWEGTVLEQKSLWGNQRALHKGGDIWSMPHRMDRISVGRGVSESGLGSNPTSAENCPLARYFPRPQ